MKEGVLQLRFTYIHSWRKSWLVMWPLYHAPLKPTTNRTPHHSFAFWQPFACAMWLGVSSHSNPKCQRHFIGIFPFVSPESLTTSYEGARLWECLWDCVQLNTHWQTSTSWFSEIQGYGLHGRPIAPFQALLCFGDECVDAERPRRSLTVLV